MGILIAVGIRISDYLRSNFEDLMSRDVKVISPEMTIREAARQMSEGDFGVMQVVEADRMISTISDRDIAIRAWLHL
jgi:CBS domain-containing protein